MCGEVLSYIKIVCERGWPAYKSGSMLFFKNFEFRCLVFEYATGPLVVIYSKKCGPRIKNAENPHQTVTFNDSNETCKSDNEFFGFKIFE